MKQLKINIIAGVILAANFCCISTSAQSPAVTITQLQNELHATTTDTGRIRVLFKIGNYYFEKRQKNTSYVDSNHAVLDRAESLSKKIKYKTGEVNAITRRAYLYHFLYLKDKELKEAARLDDTSYIKYLLLTAAYYYNHREIKENRDTLISLYTEAKARAEKTGAWILVGEQCYRLAANAYLYNEFPKAKAYATEGESAHRKAGNLERAALLWYNLGVIQDSLNPNFKEVRYCYRRSIGIFQEMKDTLSQGYLHNRIGRLYSVEGLLDSADMHLSASIELQKQSGNKGIYVTYIEMAYLKRLKGDFHQALYYALESVKMAEQDHYTNICLTYCALGIIYNDLSENQLSINAYVKGINVINKNGTGVFGALLKGITKGMIQNGSPGEALAYLQEQAMGIKNYDNMDRMLIAESYANCYMALNQPDSAEKYYMKMAGYGKLLHPSFATSSDLGLGKFYYQLKRYDSASKYLNIFLQNLQFIPPSVQGEAYLLLFKTDSSSGQYQSALEHFQKYKEKTSIVFSYQKSGQIAELQIKYDTEKKDKDLLLKDQAILLKEKDIELLRKQSSLQQVLNEKRRKDLLLKEQSLAILEQEAALNKANADAKDKNLELNNKNIDLLTRQAELQSAELARAVLLKQLTVGGILLLILILGLLYNQFRNKQKNSRTVDLKNKVLESLIGEKEWLLKEIHHRVKNNLQTVVSLLESQSAYLRNDALLAVRDSQNRIHAMSLIHQSLYQGDTIATINMSQYLPQMVAYLQDVFNTGNKIQFDLTISSIELDVSQAVPVGLILNEALTNSIKYAFTASQVNKKISVQMTEANDHEVIFIISDNGKGISRENGSMGLGLKLMNGLTGDLEGKFTLSNHAGTHISVVFTRNTLFYKKEIA